MVKLVVLLGVAAVSLAATSSAGAASAPSTSSRQCRRPALLGDPIHADVDILIDTKRVDPNAVRLDTKFDPYTRLRPAATHQIRRRLDQRCATSTCSPATRSCASRATRRSDDPLRPGHDPFIAIATARKRS